MTSWHLRHLSTFGLVSDGPPPDGGTDRRQRWWRAVASGFRFEMPDTPDGREAGRLLRAEMLTEAMNAAHQWLSEVEPELDAAWTGQAGSSNTRIRVTLEEAKQLEDAIEELLAPYVQRDEADAPPDARGVRVIRLALPERADS